MKSIFIYLFLITLPLTSLSSEFYYSWERSSQRPDSGKCYERDKKTQGQAYRSKVKDKFCKPQKTYFAFHSKSAKCFEVDDETSGDLYFSKVKIDKCKPSKTYTAIATFNKRSGCYEIDSETQGQAYFKKLKKSRCLDKKKSLHWKPLSDYEGECFSGSPGNFIRTSKSLCKTDKTKFVFVRKNKISGTCYEQDEKSGKYFSIRVKTQMCLKENKIQTYFASYMGLKSKQSECYQIDSETNGDHYINKVPLELCKE